MLYSTRNLSIIYPLQEITRRFLRSKEFSPFLITGVKNHLFQLTFRIEPFNINTTKMILRSVRFFERSSKSANISANHRRSDRKGPLQR